MVLRIPWEPMNAILAGRGQGAGTGVDAAAARLRGMAPSVGHATGSWSSVTRSAARSTR